MYEEINRPKINWCNKRNKRNRYIKQIYDINIANISPNILTWQRELIPRKIPKRFCLRPKVSSSFQTEDRWWIKVFSVCHKTRWQNCTLLVPIFHRKLVAEWKMNSSSSAFTSAPPPLTSPSPPPPPWREGGVEISEDNASTLLESNLSAIESVVLSMESLNLRTSQITYFHTIHIIVARSV